MVPTLSQASLRIDRPGRYRGADRRFRGVDRVGTVTAGEYTAEGMGGWGGIGGRR